MTEIELRTTPEAGRLERALEQMLLIRHFEQAVVVESAVARVGKLTIAPLLTLTLVCDHRAVDGSAAAESLSTVKDFLEEPGLML